LEIPEGEDPDLLQRLLANTVAGPPTSLAFHMGSSKPRDAGAIGDHGTGEVGAADAIGDASPAFGPTVSAAVPAIMTPSVGLRAGGVDHPTSC
jgi:hypothetical protein